MWDHCTVHLSVPQAPVTDRWGHSTMRVRAESRSRLCQPLTVGPSCQEAQFKSRLANLMPAVDFKIYGRDQLGRSDRPNGSVTVSRPFLDLRRRFAWVIRVRCVEFIVIHPSRDQRSTVAAPFARVSSNAACEIQSGPLDPRSTVHVC